MQYPSFLLSFFFLICLSGRRMVVGSQGTFLSPEEKGHGTLGRLLRGLLSSGPSCVYTSWQSACWWKLWAGGAQSEQSWGYPWGTLRLFVCVRSSGLSLTHLTPSQEPEGVWLAARCWEQRVWPGSVLPLNRHWVSASHFTSGISVSLSRNGVASAFSRRLNERWTI